MPRKRTGRKYYQKQISKRAQVYGPAAAQLAKDVGYLMTLVNSEPLNNNVQVSGNYDFNGVIIPLSDIAQGDGQNARTGNRILPRYLSVKLGLTKTIAGSRLYTFSRVIFFRSWIENAATLGTLTPNEVLATVGTQFAPFSTLLESIMGPKGDRSRRIEVLRSELVYHDRTGKPGEVIEYNIEMNGQGVQNKSHIEYQTGSNVPASGGIYCLFISDVDPAAFPTEDAYYLQTRLTYHDN